MNRDLERMVLLESPGTTSFLGEQKTTGVLSPFVYNQKSLTDDDDDDEADEKREENMPLLSSPKHIPRSSFVPKSPSDNPQLRRELFGQLAQETSDAESKTVNSCSYCCCIWNAFSSHIYSSFKSITAVRTTKDQCLDGFRALAFLWILAFHVGYSFQEVSRSSWKKVGYLYQVLDAWHVALNCCFDK
jgi:hypothetical protein